jgi:hypothetical protein
LRRTEVAAVDTGAEHRDQQRETAVRVRFLLEGGDLPGQPRLQDDQHQGQHDQRRNDHLERAGRQLEQQDGPDYRAGHRDDAEPDQPGGLAG